MRKENGETIKNGDYDEKTRCYIYDSSGSIVRDTVSGCANERMEDELGFRDIGIADMQRAITMVRL